VRVDPEPDASHDAYEQIACSRFEGRFPIVFSSLVGCTRRASTAASVGLLIVLALVGGCGDNSHQAAPAAAVERASTATPSAGLRDGQAVSVLALTGLPSANRTARLRVDECPSVTPAHGDCTHVGTVSRNSVETEKRGELAFTGTVAVRETVGWLHRFKCTTQCVLIVDDFFKRYGVSMTLTFR
jgi:hypothetical protein